MAAPSAHPESRWHWHYTPPPKEGSNEAYDFASIETYFYDSAANGPDLWDWWFGCLELRLPDMLRASGAPGVAEAIDHDALRRALPKARALVDELQQALAR